MSLASNSVKMRSSDRILVLAPIKNKKPLTTLGTADPRLFTGENKLHIIQDPDSSLWYLKYEQGLLPGSFKQQFTSFKKALDHVSNYYLRRNVVIKEVID